MPPLARKTVRALAVLCLGLVAAGCRASYEQRNRPVSREDLRIIERADALLADEAKWNRHDTRDCPPQASRLSLFCALQAASVEVLGSYDHRRAALQEVRFAIEDVTHGREFAHRLMDFNNLPETSFGDIKQVLAIAHRRVASRLGAHSAR